MKRIIQTDGQAGRIRPAAFSDADSVRRLMEILENAQFDRDEFSDKFSRFLSDAHHLALVYDHGGVLGFLSARTEETLHREGLCAEILDICVDP